MDGWKVCLVSVVSVAVLAGPGALVGAREARVQKHVGTVVQVNLARGILVVDEMLQGTTTRRWTIHLTPETRLVKSVRLPIDQVTDLRHPFQDTPLTVQGLKAGDYVVVEVVRHGRRLVARTVTVTLEGTS